MKEMQLLEPKREGKRILTPVFRAAFNNTIKPEKNDKGEEVYSVVMLFPKGSDLSVFTDAKDTAVAEKWPNGAPAKMANPIKDGDNQIGLKSGKVYNGYEGQIAIRAWTKSIPGVVDENRHNIVNPEDFCSGDYGQATVTAGTFTSGMNSGACFFLENVIRVGKGESLGARKISATSDFGEPVSAATDDLFNENKAAEDKPAEASTSKGTIWDLFK